MVPYYILPSMENLGHHQLFLVDAVEDDAAEHRQAADFTPEFRARSACLYMFEKRPDGYL